MQESKISPYVDAQSRNNPYTKRLNFFPLPSIPNSPDPSSPDFLTAIFSLNKPLVKQAVEERIKSGLLEPACFVLDMFCTTMIEVADELHVPSYIFFTSGAHLLNLMLYVQSLADVHGVDVATKLSDPDVELTVPGFKNPVPSRVVPAGFRHKESDCCLLLDMARGFRKSKGILVNTFSELEPVGIRSLRDELCKDPDVQTVYPVGPILELKCKGNGGADEVQEEKNSTIMQWLDDQPVSSVVFFCFGSLGCFDTEQVKEIAIGLERSGQRFLWSLRKPPSEGTVALPSSDEAFLEALPEGFVERTAQRGKIIAWAPQISVLVKELGVAVEITMDYLKDWKMEKANFTVTADEVLNG